MCLLHFISENNEYGYEMIKRIHKAFPDTKESVVYAAIRTLLKEWYIETAGKKLKADHHEGIIVLQKVGR